MGNFMVEVYLICTECAEGFIIKYPVPVDWALVNKALSNKEPKCDKHLWTYDYNNNCDC